MTATVRSAAAALLRAGLAVTVLAIIAGIFGMHVITGHHSSHGNQAAAVPVGHVHVEALPEAGHEAAGHSTSGHGAAAHSAAETPILDISSCKGSCHDMQESGSACIPTGKTGSLTVFPPHETSVSVISGPGALSGAATAYAYAPPGPTPCELSISRT